jgi:hypothetical protein
MSARNEMYTIDFPSGEMCGNQSLNRLVESRV